MTKYINYIHKGEFKQIEINQIGVRNINESNKNNSYLKHYDDYCNFFDTLILKKDNLLSWRQENNKVSKRYDISFQNLLMSGIKTKFVKQMSPPPSGWEWKKHSEERYILSFNYFLKYPYMDQYGTQKIFDGREYLDFHYFYNKKGKKILEFCRYDSNEETAKKLGKIIYGTKGEEITIPIQNFLQYFKQGVYKRINFKEITNILMEKLNDKKFKKISNLLEKCIKLQFSYEKRRRVVVNFSNVKQENFTQYFFDNFFAGSEGAFDTTNDKYFKKIFYGETLFLTGFPTPFTPPYVIIEIMGKKTGEKGKQEKKQTFIDKWIRIKQQCIGPPMINGKRIMDYETWKNFIENTNDYKNSTGFDMWILESDLKRFYKNIFQKINNPQKIKKISNCLLGLKEEELFEYTEQNLKVPSDTFYKDEDDDGSDLEDWEKDEVFERIEKEGQQFKQRERQEMKSKIQSEIKNNKDILYNLSRIQSLRDGIKKTVYLYNKLSTYIQYSEIVGLGNDKPFYNIWWFLSFGLNFFTHDKGILVGGGGKKSAFYLKGSDKWLAKGHFEFIFKEKVQCLDRFRSLLEAIKSTKRVLGKQQYLEENKGNLSFKEKIKYRKSLQQKDNKEGERQANFESLENIISAAKQSVKLFNMDSYSLSLTYANAIGSLKLNTKNYEECSKFILDRIKDIRDNLAVEIGKTEEEIKKYNKEIEQIKKHIITSIEQ